MPDLPPGPDRPDQLDQHERLDNRDPRDPLDGPVPSDRPDRADRPAPDRTRRTPERTRRGYGRRFAVLAVTLAVAVGVTAGAVALNAHARKPAGLPTDAPRTGTATVTRTDLSDTRSLPGTLGYGPATPVTGRGTGVVTALAAAGSTVTRGHPLYRDDDQPVMLFYGQTPLFRTLKAPAGKTPPTRGRDVTVVADNLTALGYDIGYRPPDDDGLGDTYTASLAAAVKRWQKLVGMARTGTLSAGQIVVLPGAIRISSVQARLGDPVAETLLSVTSTGKTVSVPVEAGDAGGITAGAKVTITLPDDRTVPGKVSAVGQSVQTQGAGQPDGNGQDSPPTLNVSVAPLHAKDVGGLETAPVTVLFTTSTRKGVLAVPVTALVALREGGYALQRTDGTLVAVTTGLFAGGQVEVSGTGISAGLRVESAS
ncbi:HlyD family secretion protein [Streptomyces sp. NBC_01476]|uniref:HlyD family efflux transporter periplasmic adaptor subunit n=1 Tax=Streptomyces sp. NBC_01476 TaxID=2903881 RepID=UPI002E33FDE6|nr:HlyD family efflux transporter periplasmic adaptor subunit [Streptomyces sp. NBC_01476]